eukprot:1030564-Rhodomonas_salina.1
MPFLTRKGRCEGLRFLLPCSTAPCVSEGHHIQCAQDPTWSKSVMRLRVARQTLESFAMKALRDGRLKQEPSSPGTPAKRGMAAA